MGEALPPLGPGHWVVYNRGGHAARGRDGGLGEAWAARMEHGAEGYGYAGRELCGSGWPIAAGKWSAEAVGVRWMTANHRVAFIVGAEKGTRNKFKKQLLNFGE